MIPIASREGASLRGRWLRLRWSQSFAGQPVRLVARFVRPEAAEEHILAAAALGRGAWTWRAPHDLERLDILAPDGIAPDLRIDELRPVSRTAILLGLLRRSPPALATVLWPGTSERGRNVTVHEAFDLADLDDFARYAAMRRRTLEPDGLDAALLGLAAAGPRLGFVFAVETQADLGPLARTLAAFGVRRDEGIRLLVLASRPHAAALDRARLDDRLEIAPLAEGASAEQATLAAARDLQTDYVAFLRPGDELTPEAILSLRAFLASRPDLDVVYADASVEMGGGQSARLKPDWSPALQLGLGYVGRPCLIRRSLLAEAPSWRELPGRVAALRGDEAIGHLKRPLLNLAPGEVVPAPSGHTASSGEAVRSTIVVPTRDRIELLRRLCESLFSTTTPGPWDLVVVDNGSEDPAALAYLAELEARSDTQVLRRPGPFNFSALVNAGVEAAAGDVVVLLNNDCEIVEADWLARLAGWAVLPGIGAVGAKLLYADGTLQHAGVALGLGGEAGHRDRKRPGDHLGALGRLTVSHEVSAVTAACLAVRRDTYRVAGGFDEALPVAFNDIDFCLRLRHLGKRNILEPRAVVVHAESASRGRDDGPRRARFLREAAEFRSRWPELILDDPYFHPMLTTFRFTDRLG